MVNSGSTKSAHDEFETTPFFNTAEDTVPTNVPINNIDGSAHNEFETTAVSIQQKILQQEMIHLVILVVY